MMGVGSGDGAEPCPQCNQIKKCMHFDRIKGILSSQKVPNVCKQNDLRPTVTSFVT